ncbi:pseudouridine synthase [Jiulongibacter sediminis]|uniref:pseudouridine synthase n=1 Tax=Jiulongibacter sediminis TaxID=1605367 RepID=UPI0026ECC58B|nr:pseudouridine synthase [Jiulongibacter sediminis]
MAKDFDKNRDERKDNKSGKGENKSFRKFDKKGESSFKKFSNDDRKSGQKKFDKNESFGDRKPVYKKFSKDDNQSEGRRSVQKRFERDNRSSEGEKRSGFKKFDGEKREGGFNKFGKGSGDRREGGFRRDNAEDSRRFDDRKPDFKKFDKDRKPGGFKKYDRDDSKGPEDKPRFDRKPGFKKFDKEGGEERRGSFRKFGGDRRDSGKDRQVGMKRPPRYDEESLKRKAPFRAKKNIEENAKPEDEDIRLNKYIANSGLCSRREADELIASGMIKVNGKVVTEMGYKVKDSDTVKYGKDVLSRERMMYILLNKPKDFITTMDDPEERRTVMDLVAGACKERVYPVGRLDRNTTGLLLLTNDGELTEKLTHPSGNVRKIYQAELDKPFSEEHFDQLKVGIELEDGFIKPDQLAYVTPDAEVVGIEIHSGKNRIVRRIFEHLGYEVTKLDRTTFGGLTKKDLPRGKWRFLSEKEVIMLKYLL